MEARLENRTTKSILDAAHEFWCSLLHTEVAVVGAGPSGLTAARFLADRGVHVAVFERHLSFGGGIWGGGMGQPEVVVEKDACGILDQFGIRYKNVGEMGLCTVGSVELAAKLGVGAIDAGVKIVTAIEVEDVVLRDNTVAGIVVNSTAITRAGLHIDPLAFCTDYVVDATGHEASVASLLARKNPNVELHVHGERSMRAADGETMLVENTREVYPGLYVTGMAANSVYGAPRMGALFGGMLLSGKKCADEIAKRLGKA
jgi:thiamine thiazole synthase